MPAEFSEKLQSPQRLAQLAIDAPSPAIAAALSSTQQSFTFDLEAFCRDSKKVETSSEENPSRYLVLKFPPKLQKCTAASLRIANALENSIAGQAKVVDAVERLVTLLSSRRPVAGTGSEVVDEQEEGEVAQYKSDA